MLVVNDGSKSIVVRGRHLATGGVMPLTNGQVVLLPSGPLSFEDFAFFLDCKRSGKQEVCYLVLDNGSLQISRMRSRASAVRVSMGLACEVEVLRPEVEFVVDGHRLYPGESVRMEYYSSFTLDGEGPFSMGEMQNALSDIGRRFRLDPGTRKLRVTNMPEKARKGDMLLTPGLAAGGVFFQRYQFRLAGGDGGVHASVDQRQDCQGPDVFKGRGRGAPEFLPCPALPVFRRGAG